jgi:hypothetical protein
MNIMGRRAEDNPQWTKTDRRMVAVAVWLAPAELVAVGGGSALASGLGSLVRVVPFLVVLLAIWSGLAREDSSAPVPLTLMRGVLGLYFVLHAVAVLLALAATAFMLFAAWVCGGRH